MENNIQTKEELIQEIKLLIDTTGGDTQINIKYINYFELDELIEIKDGLKYKKQHRDKETSDFLDDISQKCKK
jgi:hypothetical protein